VPLRDAFSACDARLIVLPGVGHALMQEAPQPLVDAMLAAS
jgi:pimeloyl-ACP methyl ester carboxylesterase